MVATVRILTSSSATSEYFRQDGGYYLADGEDAADLRAKRAEHRNASTWHGSGAVALGLHPGKLVAAGAFEKLLQGHVIGTRIRLGRLRDGQQEHRPGFDITFSAPKSVSLAALLPTEEHPHGDRAVIRAHNPAVRETLDWIEGTLLETRDWDPATRKRPRVKAPWMVPALFRHIASRNLDPQLHTHAVIANMTRDEEGRWKSVEPTLLHRNARLIGAYYRDRLARQLTGKGYSIVPAMVGRLPSFELAGYGRELRESVLDAQARDPGLCGREGLGPWRGGDAGGDARDAQAESGAGAGSAAAAMAGPRTGIGPRHGAHGGTLRAADHAAGGPHGRQGAGATSTRLPATGAAILVFSLSAMPTHPHCGHRCGDDQVVHKENDVTPVRYVLHLVDLGSTNPLPLRLSFGGLGRLRRATRAERFNDRARGGRFACAHVVSACSSRWLREARASSRRA